ncbi:MAG: DUF1273 family protein [Clostridia bacterium]|nr:DUF1273 family protein [Clostridia bacterium]
MERKEAACFTGHRELPPKGSPAYEKLVQRTRAAIVAAMDAGITRFYSGGAPGFDLLCGDLVLSLRHRYPQTQLHLLLPYPSFQERFAPEDRAAALRQRQRAASIVSLFDRYYSGCLYARDRELVKQADLCIAFLNHAPSGTAYTVTRAKEKGIPILYMA